MHDNKINNKFSKYYVVLSISLYIAIMIIMVHDHLAGHEDRGSAFSYFHGITVINFLISVLVLISIWFKQRNISRK